ncbi:MAG: tyrosine-type recombinase/integrase [Eubacteriales bacterium]
MKMTNDFPQLLSDFLLHELPILHNQSKNTIISYRDTYIQLLKYMEDEKNIISNKVQVTDLTVNTIEEFLNWLESEKGNSINTRNQRLAAIRSLFHYIQKNAPEYMFQCHQIIGIPFKKAEKRVIGFLNEEKTKELLAIPDLSTKKGLRDQALLCLLYDSGARVQELADVKVRDLHLDSPAQIKLTGKGRKTRNVPLMNQTVSILKQYMQLNKLDNGLNSDHPLFYNSQERKLTRQGITYILKKYAEQCGIIEISPHQLRHTKAMHLTEANVNPIFIRDFLGHTDLKVTEIYSKTSVKMKREALEKMDKREVIPKEETKEWNDDKELMTWLKNL